MAGRAAADMREENVGHVWEPTAVPVQTDGQERVRIIRGALETEVTLGER
jgi:hypothetical protein